MCANMCISESILVYFDLFLTWLYCPILICLLPFYFIIIPQMLVCFITRDRKDIELEDKGGGEELGREIGNCKKNICYEKHSFQ